MAPRFWPWDNTSRRGRSLLQTNEARDDATHERSLGWDGRGECRQFPKTHGRRDCGSDGYCSTEIGQWKSVCEQKKRRSWLLPLAVKVIHVDQAMILPRNPAEVP